MIEDFLNFKITDLEETEEANPKLVVRLKTSYWHDERGLYSSKKLIVLKRLTNGFNFLEEDCHMVGADEVFPRITNLHDVVDGVYEVTTCNITKDWETGYVEDYEYELVPYKEEKT